MSGAEWVAFSLAFVVALALIAVVLVLVRGMRRLGGVLGDLGGEVSELRTELDAALRASTEAIATTRVVVATPEPAPEVQVTPAAAANVTIGESMIKAAALGYGLRKTVQSRWEPTSQRERNAQLNARRRRKARQRRAA
jgi:hypothetical protein